METGQVERASGDEDAIVRTVAWRPSLYTALTAGMIAIVVGGFWPGYFSKLGSADAARHWVIHLHAAVFVGWLAILAMQATLVARGNQRLHRTLGRFGIAYGFLMLALGVLISVAAPYLRVREGLIPVAVASRIVIFNLTDMLIFGGFLVAAALHRRRPDLHRRLIVSSTVALMGAAVGRVVQGGTLLYALVWLSPLLVILVLDLWRSRRLHVITFASLVVFITALFKVKIVSEVPALAGMGDALLRSLP